MARGLEPADTLIRGGKVINVYSGEILAANVAVARGRIAYVRPAELKEGPAEQVTNADGCLLCPGYMEGHCHPWVIYNPLTLENAVLPLGTTTHIADNLPFYQYGGELVFKELVRMMEKSNSRFFWTARAIPQSMLPDENTNYSPENIETLLEMPQVVAIAEITRWKKLLQDPPSFMQKFEAAASRSKPVDGHTAGCNIDDLNALAALGIASCHEPINGEEALARLRLGLWTMVRNSSIRPDLESILTHLLQAGVSLNRLIMTTDAPEPTFVAKNGYIDGLLKIALHVGVDPLTAIRMVTLNPAVYYGLDADLGGIAPGRYGDILFLEDLQQPSPAAVMVEGEIVSRHGTLCKEEYGINWSDMGFHSRFSVPCLNDHSALTPREGEVPIIELVSSGITRLGSIHWDGKALPPGLQYCCLLGRRGEYAHACFIRGFAEGVRGLATSFTTSMGILLLGNSPKAMFKAARRLCELSGGIVLWEGDACLLELSLQIGGMMSPLPLPEVVPRLKELFELVRQRGFKHNDLLLSLLFLSCDFLPEARITPLGVLDVKKYKIIY